MAKIHLLDPQTIDQIAAGEVIERPASIVKELVENSIDAKATRVTVEIRDGGISYIRVTDNGAGISREDIRTAFLRHATSKIQSAAELSGIQSLGFRGEALSSIAAVSHTELVTKTKEEPTAARYLIEGGKEISFDDTAAPEGTTFIVRQLFFNVPARRKFLKTASTEAGHVNDIVVRLALSHPEVAFSFISQGNLRLETSGSGKPDDVIYRIFGRDTAKGLLPFDECDGALRVRGFVGRPETTRSNRSYEFFFVNGRYIKSPLLSKALEEGYREYAMQHKFPFAVVHIETDGEGVDVNVHPTKMEVRFQRQNEVFGFVQSVISRAMRKPDLIPSVTLGETKKTESPSLQTETVKRASYSQPLFAQPVHQPSSHSASVSYPQSALGSSGLNAQPVSAPAHHQTREEQPRDEQYFLEKMRERVLSYHNRSSSAETEGMSRLFRSSENIDVIRDKARQARESEDGYRPREAADSSEKSAEPVAEAALNEEFAVSEEGQLSFIRSETKPAYKVIGQLFATYWLLEYEDQLYIVDQHAAHEKILYERTVKQLGSKEYGSQYLSPPTVVHVSMREKNLIETYRAEFEKIGFILEEFGEDAYSIRAVPSNLFGLSHRDVFIEMLDELDEEVHVGSPGETVLDKIASISCKAAVKGNHRMSTAELTAMMDELFTMENPFCCPHGRPTMITMSKREMEKKFKRII